MTLVEDRRAELGEERQGSLLAAYATDRYTWALEQADCLRFGRLDLIDAKNIGDEIEVSVHYLADKLRSDLSRVLQHMLEWDHRQKVRTRSGALSVREHRKRVARHLRQAPGLRSILNEDLEDAYQNGRRHALNETGLPQKSLPETCPYSWDEIMTRPIEWPETA